MSQIFKGVTAGSLPPSVPTSFVTDSETATPVANVLNVLGNDTTQDNSNGIETTGSGNTVTVLFTNRLQGTGSTVGAVTSDIITFSLGATPATYVFEFKVCGFNASTPAGVGYNVFGSVRTTGAPTFTATLIGTPDFIVNEEAALTAADVDLVVSGNNAILRVTGVIAVTIDWSSVGLYTVVS